MKEKNKWIILVIIIWFISCLLCGFISQNGQQIQQENIQNEIVIEEEIENKELEIINEEILYTTTDVNMRSGPSMNNKIIDTLSVNTEVIKIGEENNWAKIKWSNTEIYYIYNKYLSTEKTIIVKQTKNISSNNSNKYNNIIADSTNEYQNYAYNLVLNYGWSGYDFECLVKLWTKESEWNPNCHNNSSGAHGIPQSLPASKMASEGEDYYTNGYTQIRWGLKYIKERYGTPQKAWSFWLSHHWY